MMRISFLTLLLLFTASVTLAQPNGAHKPALNEGAKTKTEKDPEAERVLRERRANAQSLLISLAADAAKFQDQTLRARTEARIADALWDADAERARTLFRHAWDAAEVADREGQQRQEEEIRQARAKTGGGYAISSPPELRREVLRLAAKHDRALGEELLEKFKQQKTQEAEEARNRNRADESVSERLGLARQLLEAGDKERALQFADPVLNAVTIETVDFLSYLREADPAAADQRYAAMLTSAAGNSQSDANTVSLLSAYIFTPHLFVTFRGTGAGTSQTGSRIDPPAVPAALRESFLRAGASILLRPLAPPGQDQTSSGPDGQYLMIKRLMPLFEQFGSPDTVAALRTQLEVLSSLVRESTRQRDDDTLRKGIRPELPVTDREKALLDQIDRAKTSTEQDSLYMQLAMYLANKGDLRARDYVGKIEQSEMRANLRPFIDSSLAARAVNKKDVNQALELIRTGELTHLQKAYFLTQTAKLLAKSDRDKAESLIEDGALEARRIDPADPDRPRAFLAVTNALRVTNPPAAWDVISEAIKAANSAEAFTGEDGQLTFSFYAKGTSSVHQSGVADFDVMGIFGTLAQESYEKAVDLARGFQYDAPRASATIAIARAVLEEKKK
jgi:hypothetical protein